jgi:putative flippase GtrA
MITRQRVGEIARYVATGLIGASVNVGLSVLLTEYLGLHYLVSLGLVSALVILVGFFLNRSWTFRRRGRTVVAEFCRYVLVTSVNVVIGLIGCALLVQEGRVPYAYAIAIVAVVFAPMIYLVHRAWTFGLSWLHES